MMQQPEKQLSVTWRGKKFIIVMDQGANLKELGDKLQKLTNVKTDTLRLIVPTDKGSKLLYPFSDEHSYLPLEAASTLEGKPIRMMGVPENEVDEILQNAKTDLRIAGFDEEEKRMRRRIFDERNSFVQLPQGTYVFSEFRTLSIPGIELSPPASEALKLMHRLAADPGIVAIMEKHRWRVGIMTEMAPVGYVGVSPKCILGFNKNHGEEISLRLRTDDLNGFRKYESIKKTLLHELAHMVYSEHDADFYALDKQLNQEAAALDWTKTKGHTLNGVRHALNSEEESDNRVSLSRKLGGQGSGFSNARASSVAAAYHRFANTSTDGLRGVSTHEEPDPDDSGCTVCQKHDCLHAGGKTEVGLTDGDNHTEVEPDPDDSLGGDAMESESCLGCGEIRVSVEPDPDDSEELKAEANEESAHSNLKVRDGSKVGQNLSEATETTKGLNQPKVIHLEPDPDDSQAGSRLLMKPSSREPDPDDSWASVVVESELEPDDNMMVSAVGMSMGQVNEPDPDDMELQRIQDPVAAVYSRLQKAMEMLRSEVNPLDAAAVLQTLVKIIRNVIEHPDEMKFKKIRKANAIIQRNILHYGAAVEILRLVGFSEDVVFDEMGIAETYLVLKRNDPGLLWLVKNSLESYNA